MIRDDEEWDSAIDAALDICEKLLSREEEAQRVARRSRIFSPKEMLREERVLTITAVMDEIKTLKR